MLHVRPIHGLYEEFAEPICRFRLPDERQLYQVGVFGTPRQHDTDGSFRVGRSDRAFNPISHLLGISDESMRILMASSTEGGT